MTLFGYCKWHNVRELCFTHFKATVARREKVPRYARVLATLGFSLNFILAVIELRNCP